MRLILGSQSARRKEILSFFAIPFVQIPSLFDEESVSFNGIPSQYVLELSLKKAQEISHRFPNDMILAADTIVYFEGTVFNKPKDHKKAHEMLRRLSGKWHSVFTALTLLKQGNLFSEFEETKILFNDLSDEHIERYHQSCAFTDKAGGYAIQQAGSICVARIEGCYYNVMGLPVNTTRRLLSKAGVDLWRHLKPF